MKKNFIAGFTLIELMVVIVIIGILATLGLVTYRNALIRSRDSRAIGTVKDIISALEQRKAAGGINSSYANIGSGTCTNGLITGTDYTITSGNPNPYSCTQATSGSNITGYCISVQMENNQNGNCTGCSSGTAYNSGTSHFCAVTKQ